MDKPKSNDLTNLIKKIEEPFHITADAINAWWRDHYIKELLKNGCSEETVATAIDYLTDSNNFPFLFVGLNGNIMEPEELKILKSGSKPNMSALWEGQVRITRQWIGRVLDNDTDMMLALHAQMAHEHCHHLYDYPTTFAWEALHQSDNILISWINECRADTMGCLRAFDGDPVRAHRAMEYFKSHASKSGLNHSNSHPSWEFRQMIAERGVFDEESIRLITEEARKYIEHHPIRSLFFKDFSQEAVQEINAHAEKLFHEDLSFCLDKEEKKDIEKEKSIVPARDKALEKTLEQKHDMSIAHVKEIIKGKKEEKSAERLEKRERKKEKGRK